MQWLSLMLMRHAEIWQGQRALLQRLSSTSWDRQPISVMIGFILIKILDYLTLQENYIIPCIYSWDNCIFTPSWFLPTGFALTFRACSVLPLLFPSRSLDCPVTVWPKLWKFITNSDKLRKMQIRYQNVQINITFMGISFAFRTKAWFKLPEVINIINIIKKIGINNIFFVNKNYMQM